VSILFRKNSKPRKAISDVFRDLTENVLILIFVYLGSLILASLVLSPIEGWRFLEGLWWAQVSSLTIGYGDLFPKTDQGKIIAMIFQCFWALYIVLCLAGHVVKFLFRDKNEITHEEQEWFFSGLEMQDEKLNALALQNERLAQHFGFEIDMTAFRNPDGTLRKLAAQPSDTSYGNIERANAKAASNN
jgi:voltage-gated potassium channel